MRITSQSVLVVGHRCSSELPRPLVLARAPRLDHSLRAAACRRDRSSPATRHPRKGAHRRRGRPFWMDGVQQAGPARVAGLRIGVAGEPQAGVGGVQARSSVGWSSPSDASASPVGGQKRARRRSRPRSRAAHRRARGRQAEMAAVDAGRGRQHLGIRLPPLVPGGSPARREWARVGEGRRNHGRRSLAEMCVASSTRSRSRAIVRRSRWMAPGRGASSSSSFARSWRKVAGRGPPGIPLDGVVQAPAVGRIERGELGLATSASARSFGGRRRRCASHPRSPGRRRRARLRRLPARRARCGEPTRGAAQDASAARGSAGG